jgi:hypothetical protein
VVTAEALTIPGVEAGIWQVRNRFDSAAASIADRHYSREKVGSPQVGGPGFVLVMVTPCERACWISKRHSLQATGSRSLHDGFGSAFRCALFRNEGAGLSSDLIVEAMTITETLWGVPPLEGWVTYVRRDKVRSRNPGFCFKKAGWHLDRTYEHPRFVRLLA